MKMRVVLFTLLASAAAFAAEPKTPRMLFAEAKKAAEANDAKTYLEKMQEATSLDIQGGDRPVFQYHLARAYALNGKTAESLGALEQAWNERIEGPMIVFADYDPAFASLRETPGYAKVRALFDTLRIDLLPASGNVFEVQGAGCTLAASIGADGVLMVDSGYPRTTGSVLRALKKQAGAEPRVRYVLDTHGHFDHTAANADFGGDPIVVAHEAAAEEMKNGSEFTPGFRIPPVAAAAMPDILTRDALTVRFNGENVRFVPLPAHTDGDAVVWFETSKVLHMGDDYFGADSTMIYPGEKPAEFFATLGALMDAIPDDAVVLSGHAGRVPASKLRATFKDSHALFEHVRDGIAAGKDDEAILASAAAWQPRWVRFYLQVLRR
jgi:cyclase